MNRESPAETVDSMNMVWLAILTLIAGSTSGSVASRDLGSVCLAAKPRIGVAEGVPVRTHLQTIARRVDGVPRTPPWSSPLLEEFDTPEVDETWMVDLDVVTTIPIAWICWAKPRSSVEDSSINRSLLSLILVIPLRC